jgi:hypothetical protein
VALAVKLPLIRPKSLALFVATKFKNTIEYLKIGGPCSFSPKEFALIFGCENLSHLAVENTVIIGVQGSLPELPKLRCLSLPLLSLDNLITILQSAPNLEHVRNLYY